MENENDNAVMINDEKSYITKVCGNPKCKKPFQTTSNKRKFCTPECSARNFALNYYNKIKDEESHKQKRKEGNRKWISTHREEFNSRMRVYAKNYYHRKKDQKQNNSEASAQPEITNDIENNQ